jgi:hypothetical protein
MHEKVLEVENRVVNPRDCSSLPARITCSKNYAISKNCAKVNGIYLKTFIINKNFRRNPNIDYRFIKWCLIPGKIKMQGAKTISVKNFINIYCPALSICTTFRIYNVYWL